METNYIKGEPLDTAEKFVKWVAQDKPYYYGCNNMVVEDLKAPGFYKFAEQSLNFQAIPAPEKKVTKLCAYEREDQIFFSTEDTKWLFIDHVRGLRAPELDIYYPEKEEK